MDEPTYEIRDAIHATIRCDEREIAVVNSRPVQRLRHIRQLGSAYMLYPGANHSRFEHSLGTLELATRVFDSVTKPDPGQPAEAERLVREHRPERRRWRHAVRMAALCHDIGHLPFSHSAELALLPAGYSHERLTLELIMSEEMAPFWRNLGLTAELVGRLAVGPKFFPPGSFSPWEKILTGIITGDAFGVDRMDYLLRDSYHIGVAYGTIDHHRLIDTIRILPLPAPASTPPSEGPQFQLGIREGGLHSAEALMVARYLMFEQVYCHHVAQVYDQHLVDFMRDWLPGGVYDVRLESHLRMTDNELMAAMRGAYFDRGPGYESARAVIERDHLKLLFEPTPAEMADNPAIGMRVFEALGEVVPPGALRYRPGWWKTDATPDFPVLLRDGTILFSKSISRLLGRIPALTADYIFVEREHFAAAGEWLRRNRARFHGPAVPAGPS